MWCGPIGPRPRDGVIGMELELPEKLKGYDYKNLFEKGFDKETETIDEKKLTDINHPLFHIILDAQLYKSEH